MDPRSMVDGPAVPSGVSRRSFLAAAGALGMLAGLERLTPAYARPLSRAVESGRLRGATIENEAVRALLIRATPLEIGSRRATVTTITDTLPGPLLRLREGEDYTLRVTNELDEDTSIHWHGLIVPNGMDGVPGVTFPGIRPRKTFTYRLPIRQYGAYWYHSHSGLSDFFSDARWRGLLATIKDRLMWAKMRMAPTDISDITGATYTYLLNGLPPESNWTGLFRPGERVRLRIINAGAGTCFDVRIPGLEMTVVAVSGQNVRPVVTDDFRMEIAQTFDVIVRLTEAHAYTIFAESMDRSGYTRGTLAPRAGMVAPIPRRRPQPLLLMGDMGMAKHDMSGMDMPGTNADSMGGMT